MSDFEKDLANVMGSFMEVNLDCVEKQNQEIEQLQQENNQLKEDYETLHNKFINYLDKQDFAKLCKISRPYLDKLLKGMNRQQIYKYCETRNKIKEIGG